MVAISPPIGSYQSSVSKKHRTHSAPGPSCSGPLVQVANCRDADGSHVRCAQL